MISWLFAKFYDRLMRDAEERCLRQESRAREWFTYL